VRVGDVRGVRAQVVREVELGAEVRAARGAVGAGLRVRRAVRRQPRLGAVLLRALLAREHALRPLVHVAVTTSNSHCPFSHTYHQARAHHIGSAYFSNMIIFFNYKIFFSITSLVWCRDKIKE
jgi:hypothetical protein